MTERQRWFGILVLAALLVWSKSGGGLPFVVEPKADKLWIVAIDDYATRTPQQNAVLSDRQFWDATGHNYEHYEAGGAEAAKYAAFHKFADELIFQDANGGKVLGVVEIPANPPADWATSQIARFAK